MGLHKSLSLSLRSRCCAKFQVLVALRTFSRSLNVFVSFLGSVVGSAFFGLTLDDVTDMGLYPEVFASFRGVMSKARFRVNP